MKDRVFRGEESVKFQGRETKNSGYKMEEKEFSCNLSRYLSIGNFYFFTDVRLSNKNLLKLINLVQIQNL